MKSGPTFAAPTRCPARRSAAIKPVATVVLPTPECVPATTMRPGSSGTGQYSMPLRAMIPASMACLTLVISVTVSAISISSGAA